MVNGSLVQFYPVYYLQLRVLLSVTYGCMCKKKRPGKKSTIILVGIPLLFPSFLLNF